MTITWNPVLRARAGEPVLRNLATTGGRSSTGREQRVIGDAGFWVVPMRSIVVNTRDKAAAYRSMVARLRQGEDILVPVCDLYTPRGARSSAAAVTMTADAALRSTQIGLTCVEVDIQAGHHFTIGDRLHLVTEIVSGPVSPPFLNAVATDTPFRDDEPWTDAVTGSSAYVVKITPPLRAAATAGQSASFRDLRLRCVLQDLGDGDLDLDLGRFGTPSLTFIESV